MAGSPKIEDARQALKKYWGYPGFRPGQDKAVASVLEGKETLILFPTGGGKSLCYQVPAMVTEGLTLVISPLVALMEDQVDQLNAIGIPATFINSTIRSKEIEQRLVNARNGMYKLVYCAPERLHTPLFQHELLNLKIRLVAVDEAHCISEWGHDFRPPYREIREALEPAESQITWIALTATATPEVREDIISVLRFKNPNIISRGFDRPNLRWWVFSKPNKFKAALQIVRKSKGSGLIYAGTRKACEETASTILEMTGIKTAAYHAGLEPADRTAIQDAWIKGTIPLVAATNAFGMGIDKPDCRYVVHLDPPASLEAYYQEAGRAGRDGNTAYPLLCYRTKDIRLIEELIKKSYPDFEQTKAVYQGLCDYFELAEGSVMEQPEPADPENIAKRSGTDSKTVLAGFNVLNRMKIIDIIEEHQTRIALRFLIDLDSIRELESKIKNQKKAEFIRNLYRLFGPESETDWVRLDLKSIAQKSSMSSNKMIMGLKILQEEDIIQYRTTSNQPLVQVIHPREKIVPFKRTDIEHYRNILLAKLRHIKGYAETSDCRSRYLRIYFGESNPPACGVCDNCKQARQKPTLPTTESLEKIVALLSEDQKTTSELLRDSGIQGMELYKSLQWLIREGRISGKTTAEGEVYELIS